MFPSWRFFCSLFIVVVVFSNCFGGTISRILSHSQKILTFGPSKEKSLPINPTSTASATLPATLKNLGQTCYVNAVIQSLYYSPYRAAVLGERRGIFASSSSAVAATTVDTISAHNCAAAAGDDDGRAGAGDITSSGCGGEKTAISCNDESTSENDHGVDASKGLCDIGTASRLRSRSRKFAHFSTGAVLEALFRRMDDAKLVPCESSSSNSNVHTVLDPTALITAMGVEVGWQEDAQEFLLTLLDQVDGSMLSEPDRLRAVQDKDVPSSALMGSMQQTIECLDSLRPCRRQQTSSFATIGVDLFSQPKAEAESNSSPIAASAAASDESFGKTLETKDLNHYLRKSLLEPEYLTGSNQLHVQKTPSATTNPAMESEESGGPMSYTYQDAKKYNYITAPLPEALYLHLHRFTYDVLSGQLRKVNKPVSFPLVLDMQPYISPETFPLDPGEANYELSTIVVHLGSNAEHGHYITFVRQNSTSTSSAIHSDTVTSMITVADVDWIRLDDARRPQRVTGRDVISTAVTGGGAYMLGYTRLAKMPK